MAILQTSCLLFKTSITFLGSLVRAKILLPLVRSLFVLFKIIHTFSYLLQGNTTIQETFSGIQPNQISEGIKASTLLAAALYGRLDKTYSCPVIELSVGNTHYF